MGLLDFKVCVVLALRPEPDCSAQPQSMPAVPTTKHPCSAPTTKCSSAEYPCSAQAQNILQCLATKYPCSAQPPRSLQCPPTKCPCSAHHQAYLQCLTTKYPCSAQPQSIPNPPRNITFFCNNGFRVGMLEVNNFAFALRCLVIVGRHQLFGLFNS